MFKNVKKYEPTLSFAGIDVLICIVQWTRIGQKQIYIVLTNLEKKLIL